MGPVGLENTRILTDNVQKSVNQVIILQMEVLKYGTPLYCADCWRQQGSGAMHRFNATHLVVHFSRTTGWQGTYCIPKFSLTQSSAFSADSSHFTASGSSLFCFFFLQSLVFLVLWHLELVELRNEYIVIDSDCVVRVC